MAPKEPVLTATPHDATGAGAFCAGWLVVGAAAAGSCAALAGDADLLVPAAIAGALATLAVLRYPVVFVLAYGLYLPFEEYFLKWLSGTAFIAARYLPEITLYLAAAVVLARLLSGAARWRTCSLELPVALLCIAALISVCVNGTDLLVAGLGVRIILRFAAATIILLHAGTGERLRVAFIRWIVAVLVIQAALSCLQLLLGHPFTEHFRAANLELEGVVYQQWDSPALEPVPAGTFPHYNNLGNFAAIAAVMALAGSITGALPRGHAALALGAALAAIAAGGSRQGLMALLAGCGVILTARMGWRRLFPLALALLLGVAIIAEMATAELHGLRNAVGSLQSREYFTDLRVKLAALGLPELYEARPETNFRLYLIAHLGGELLQRSPLLGIGPGTFGSTWSVARHDPIYAQLGVEELATPSLNYVSDVNWITLMGQFGILGTAAFAAVLFAGMRAGLRTSRDPTADPARRTAALALAAVGAMVALLGIFGANFEIRTVSYYFWTLAGLGTTTGLESRSLERAP